MISEAQAWRNFEEATEQAHEWRQRYDTLYLATAEQLRKRHWDRQGERITLDQAKAMVDALTTPTGYAKLNETLSTYLRYMNESRFWKDVWQAVHDHGNQPG